jgi:RNA polymerase sigma factor for flagellar operon FliA
MYYKSDRTMREVADSLGLSESRVSQLHSQALVRLRAILADDLLVAD